MIRSILVLCSVIALAPASRADQAVALDDILRRADPSVLAECPGPRGSIRPDYVGLLRDMYGIPESGGISEETRRCLDRLGSSPAPTLLANDADRTFILRSNDVYECIQGQPELVYQDCPTH